MGSRRIVIRILGVASTTRGFAFALTEGPKRLVTWGLRRRAPTQAAVVSTLKRIVESSRPLFVAFEQEASERKGRRGKRFGKMLSAACRQYGVMIHAVDSKTVKLLAGSPKASKWQVAHAVSKRFREIQHKLPQPRRAWQGEDDRIGSFLALAAALTMWDGRGIAAA